MIFVHLIQSASTLPAATSALESSISTFEREVAALESSSISLERLLQWFTGLVALGVALELWVIWREYRNERGAWARGTICSPEKPPLTQFAVQVLSVLLIAGGIVGELGVGIKITSLNGMLRSKNAELRSASDRLLALVTQQAGDAAVSAKTAHEDADAVGKEAATLMTELGEAEGKLRQLQVFALARHISDTDALVEGLRPLKGKQVVLRSYLGDAEGWLLCVSLLDAVQKAQINVTNQCGQWPFDVGKPVTGLNISGPGSDVVADAVVVKGRTTGGAVATTGPVPLVIFAGIKNPFWLPEQALAASPQQKSKNNTRAIRKTAP